MEIGMIGLGRMGGNMARRLLAGGHRVAAYDPQPEAVQAVGQQGAWAPPPWPPCVSSSGTMP